LHYFGEGAKRFPLRGGECLIMQWPDLSMGGYGFYVWGSYLFSLIVIVWELVSLRQRKKALVKDEKSSAVRAAVLRGSTNETTS
jgi:heme exporter protein D